MIMRLIVPMAALLLVILVACGGELKPTPSSTATFAPSPTPSPTATFVPSPTPSPTFTPATVVVRERSRLTPEQDACLAEAIGERAAREVSTGRPPSSDELDAFGGCGIAVAVGEGNEPTPEPVAVGQGNGLTPEQEACLVEAIGERAVLEWKTGQRLPTSDEVDALVGCGIMEPQPSFDLLPEASAPAGLGTVDWPNNVQESSALFERLPSEIVMGVTIHDLTKGGFFPPDTNAGQFVAVYAGGATYI